MDPPLHDEGGAPPALRQKRSDSPEPSCVSMRSDSSKNLFVELKGDSDSQHRQKTSDSPEPSCVSMRSDSSKNLFVELKGDRDSQHRKERSDSPEPSCVSMRSDSSKNLFVELKGDCDSQHRQKRPDSETSYISMKSDTSKDVLCGNIKAGSTSDHSTKFKTNLRKKFEHLHEGIAKQGNPTLLNEIYTDLLITVGENGETDSSSKTEETEDTPINSNDIFMPLPGQDEPIRTVLTKGVAGFGKTISVQKFILDWAEEKANQDVHLIFPLPFRELNLLKDQTFSLQDLLHFFMDTNQLEISLNEDKILFIFDGLDECRLSLDFQNNIRLCDVTESASVDVLLTNLIKGNLLPSALIWITGRPAAADLIPSEYVHRVTEVRGFNDPQKVQYFRKRIRNEFLAEKIIMHLKSSRTLYVMCHIPVFCWISATVLENMLSQPEIGEIPKTLTQMYTHFLIIQTNIKHEKNYEMTVNDEDMILKLGKLAFQQLMKGNLIFYEEDLREHGIDVIEASVYSGLCTCREDMHQRKVYSFVHLTIQEHLAALYVHHSFTKNNINVFDVTEPTHEAKNKQVSIFDLHQKALDEAVDSKTGHLDLFLRFLLGFSLKSNQTLLKCLLTQTERRYHNLEETVKYIKKKIEENPIPEKFINLFHCLDDLGDYSVIEEILWYLNTKSLTNTLSSLQWSALIFVLLTSENLAVFKFKNYAPVKDSAHMPQILLKLLPVIEASTSVQLNHCGLTETSCVHIAKALCSEASCVMELNLSKNTLKDEGVKFISKGLQNPHCKLEILRLRNCDVTNESSTHLNLVLTSISSHLRELDLSENKLGDSGLKLLCDALQSPNCKLEKLIINDCGVTEEGCAALASVIQSNPSQLKELDLSNNQLGYSEVKFFSGLKSPLCKLECLRLGFCGLFTEEGCDVLASALNSNSHLKTLDLTGNKLGNTGTKLFSAILKNPNSNLETLCLHDCGLTDEGCAALALVLGSNLSKLRELDLSENKLGDLGVKLLSAGLEDPHCKLEMLKLIDCGLTDKDCADLTLALSSHHSCLKELILAKNKFGDLGIKHICSKIQNLHSKLEALWLFDCDITDEGCEALASALISNLSHLKLLYLCDKKVTNTGVRHLSVALKNPVCELEILGLYDCDITSEGLFALSSVLTENPPLPLNDMNIKVRKYLLYKFKENSNNEQDSNS
ncbi:hypothetical protein QQF64_008886 [Cirrhinus molitorella]|uniref:NACHT domain-containing protein n=1 Tax=Cirrhinus molitorella TaxID=172907 RepID=A0ABR3MAT3_9TELE